MKIIPKKEKLILTKEERAILLKAFEILEEIYDNSEAGGELENYAHRANDGLGDILDEAETENATSGTITVTLTI